MPGQSADISVHVPQGKAAGGARPSRSPGAPTALAGQWTGGGGGGGGDAQVLAELRANIAEEMPRRARARPQLRALGCRQRVEWIRRGPAHLPRSSPWPRAHGVVGSARHGAGADGARVGSGITPGGYP